ncbi:MAG: hypothetical protein ACRC33_21970 [Gemmataceae bacterium]
MNLNLYFLVEGRRTEARVYPEWLKRLLPRYTRVAAPDDAAGTNYYLISGEGYPRLLDVTLANAVAEINACGRYAYLLVCLDADECSVEERRAEVRDRIADEPLDPAGDVRRVRPAVRDGPRPERPTPLTRPCRLAPRAYPLNQR